MLTGWGLTRRRFLVTAGTVLGSAAMPVMVELGIGENGIHTSERPDRTGYLAGQVPDEIRDWWKNRSMWGRFRTEIRGEAPYDRADQVPASLHYKLISNQGHLRPRYGELLQTGLAGVQQTVTKRQPSAADPSQSDFLAAADAVLNGLSDWIGRYAEFLRGEAQRGNSAGRSAELREMARIAAKVATQPPDTFREALQLIWFVHQAIHVEGHGYSCTPDRIDQLLFPFYEADRRAGRLDDAQSVRLLG